MNYSEENSELFDLYLNGKLRGTELTEFEKRISDDKEFAESFNLHHLIVSGIREHGKQELKIFLKENGMVKSGVQKLIPYKIYYALAAVFVLFIGVYVILHFYVHPNDSPVIAINNTPKEVFTLDSQALQLETENLTEALPPGVSQKDHLVLQNEKNRETFNTPPAELSVEMETSQAGTVGSINEGVENNGKGTASKKESDIYVATEIKMNDTTVQIPVLYVVLEEKISDHAEVVSTKNISVRTAERKKEKKNKKMIPANTGAGDDDKMITRKDTQVSKANEKSSVDIEHSIKSMHIEFWQSPLKFIGYKYTSNTIQFYGLTDPAFKLYMVNSNIYLRTKGIVFVLTPCSDACPFKKETNTKIIDFIIQQD